MSVSATGIVTSARIGPVDPNNNNQQLVYYVAYSGSITDGTTAVEFSSGQVLPTFIFTAPLGTKSKKMDRLIRESMAAAALAASGFSIDPDDIYIPFS